MKNLKKETHKHIISVLDEKLIHLSNAIEASMQSRDNETKSSMGDKYETGRAMVQSEIDKLVNNKIACKNLLDELKNINPEVESDIVNNGSLVETNHELFYFSIPYGKINIGNKEVFVISLFSPIGMVFKSKRAGDIINFKGKTYTIISVS